MTDSALPADLAAIDELIESGDFAAAQTALDRLQESEAAGVLRIKLGMHDGSLEPGPAMQRLIAIMRNNANAPGAKELYQEASNIAYRTRTSSVSHSHPPPPVTEEENGERE
jgi:hypothetical protein